MKGDFHDEGLCTGGAAHTKPEPLATSLRFSAQQRRTAFAAEAPGLPEQDRTPPAGPSVGFPTGQERPVRPFPRPGACDQGVQGRAGTARCSRRQVHAVHQLHSQSQDRGGT